MAVPLVDVAPPELKVMETPTKEMEKGFDDRDVRIRCMGATVVGGSCDRCPMFWRSQSTWSSTLVYTPWKEKQDGQRLQVCWRFSFGQTVLQL